MQMKWGKVPRSFMFPVCLREEFQTGGHMCHWPAPERRALRSWYGGCTFHQVVTRPPKEWKVTPCQKTRRGKRLDIWTLTHHLAHSRAAPFPRWLIIRIQRKWALSYLAVCVLREVGGGRPELRWKCKTRLRKRAGSWQWGAQEASSGVK